MIGAGDIKLFSMIGAFTGPDIVLKVMLLTFLFAAGICVVKAMLHRDRIKERFACFAGYVREFFRTGIPKPYLAAVPEKFRICLAPAMLVSIVFIWWQG